MIKKILRFLGFKAKVGFYKTKFTKKPTIIQTFDKYNEEGDVKFSLIKGGNISETEEGIGIMGFMSDEQCGKKDRFYSLKSLNHYFEYIGQNLIEEESYPINRLSLIED